MIAGKFKAGQDVPSWLLDQEPRTDMPVGTVSKPGTIKFLQDAIIVEIDNAYWILPARLDPPGMPSKAMIMIDGCQSCNILAPGKRAVTPLTWQVVGNHGD